MEAPRLAEGGGAAGDGGNGAPEWAVAQDRDAVGDGGGGAAEWGGRPHRVVWSAVTGTGYTSRRPPTSASPVPCSGGCGSGRSLDAVGSGATATSGNSFF